jgi:uncharacterized damage-inducible protein DinB
MTDVDEQGRPEPPIAADESATLTGFLDFQRATFAWKCAALDAAGLDATVGASSMTLGGMLKHLALVEDHWFGWTLHARDRTPPWDTIDWDADPDWEWRTARDDSPEDLRALYDDCVRRGDAGIDRALTTGGLDAESVRTSSDQGAFSLRWILLHMIEEYARHNGQADLIRESVDGMTGE